MEGTTDLCTPAEVARLNMHVRCARYLKKAVGFRRKEDKVLAEDSVEAAAKPHSPAMGFMKVTHMHPQSPMGPHSCSRHLVAAAAAVA